MVTLLGGLSLIALAVALTSVDLASERCDR